MNDLKFFYTPNRLFAVPSFIEGMASVVDLAGLLHQDYNYSPTGREADSQALKNDWQAVGDDFKWSVLNYERELTGATK